MNIVLATGNIGRDGELRYTANGNSVLDFSLASSNGRGDKKTTTWYRCSVWGKRGEAMAPYIVKGVPVTVVGQMDEREWTTQEGEKRTTLEINVQEIELHGKRQMQIEKREPKKSVAAPVADDPDDDIPF